MTLVRERPIEVNGKFELTPCALVDELRHGGAQLGDAGAAARRGHEHLRVRRRVPGEHRLGRGKKCRALGLLHGVGFGQYDLVVDPALSNVSSTCLSAGLSPWRASTRR